MRQYVRVVVIGGGIVGCSVLYHLTRAGWPHVVLIEKGELASGSTWHAAGNTPHFNTGLNVSRIHLYSTELYQRVEAETGQAVGFHKVGSLRLASVADRMDEYRRHCGKARTIGLPFEVVGPAEIKQLHPLVETQGLLGAAWNPDDGHVDPTSVTQALAKGARDKGAEVYRHTRVTAIAPTRGKEWHVTTDRGEITTEVVVIAAGTWAREVGQMVGLDLPIVPMEHQYIVTEAIPEVAAAGRELPLVREVDASYYLRQEGHGFLVGPYETNAKPFGVRGIPPDFGANLLPPDFARLQPFIELAMTRIPVLTKTGIMRIVNGPITFTPDGNGLLGPAFGLKNVYLACGFSFGITQAGGAGKYLAEWIIEGQPSVDLWDLDPRRYGSYATRAYTVARCVDIYEKEFAIIYPEDDRRAGRPARVSPLYDRFKSMGAVFGVRNGWERPYWFAPRGVEAKDVPSFRRSNWFKHVAFEARAVRERVGVLELSSLSKFEVRGKKAGAFLDRLCANRLPSVSRVAVSQMLNERGTIECDVTVAHLQTELFVVMSAAAAELHDLDWLLRHAPSTGVQIENVTNRYGVLILAGPRARDVLAKLTDADLTNNAFPWFSVRGITVGYTPVRVQRINFVGELGWELHHPIEYQVGLYDALMDAGAEYDIVNFGLRAMESLRLEKAYRVWGTDINTEVTPLEAGLERFVAFDKVEFIGRSALLRQKRAGVRKRLATLDVEAVDADCHGNEAVHLDGRVVGITTSGGYAHWLGKSLAVAYLDVDAAVPGKSLEVEILGERRPAIVTREPLFDPENSRPRA